MEKFSSRQGKFHLLTFNNIYLKTQTIFALEKSNSWQPFDTSSLLYRAISPFSFTLFTVLLPCHKVIRKRRFYFEWI